MRDKQKEYVENNREVLKIKWEIYRNNNKDKINQWFFENKEYRKVYKKEYNEIYKERRNNLPRSKS